MCNVTRGDAYVKGNIYCKIYCVSQSMLAERLILLRYHDTIQPPFVGDINIKFVTPSLHERLPTTC